jgi:putative membrane protein
MQNSRKTFGTLALLGALTVSPLLLAQTPGDAAAPSAQDSMFVAKASAGGMTEIQASKLADSHSQSGTIKSFASKMVTDHTAAGDKLTSIAQKDGFTPASAPMAAPMAAQQKELAKLETLNGMAFDKAYSSMMVKDHDAAVALFKKETTAGSNADLKSFASETLPTIEQHQMMAKKLRMKAQ